MAILSRINLFIILVVSLYINACFAGPQPLDENIIQHWMSSQIAFEAWGKEHEATLSTYKGNPDEINNPMEMSVESMIKPLKAVGLFTSANKLAQEQGFDSMSHWASTTLRITKAAAAIEFAKHPEMLNLSKLEELANSQKMDRQQKKLLIQAIKKNKAIVEQFITGTSEPDQQAIKPFLSRIHQLMSQ